MTSTTFSVMTETQSERPSPEVVMWLARRPLIRSFRDNGCGAGGANGRGSHGVHPGRGGPGAKEGGTMIILGVILIILGAILDIGILYTIGVILAVVGAILWLLGAIGRPVAGRRYYY